MISKNNHNGSAITICEKTSGGDIIVAIKKMTKIHQRLNRTVCWYEKMSHFTNKKEISSIEVKLNFPDFKQQRKNPVINRKILMIMIQQGYNYPTWITLIQLQLV